MTVPSRPLAFTWAPVSVIHCPSSRRADPLVLDADPLEDIRNSNTTRFVLKNGRMYDGDTLDEVSPRARKAGPFYWAGE